MSLNSTPHSLVYHSCLLLTIMDILMNFCPSCLSVCWKYGWDLCVSTLLYRPTQKACSVLNTSWALVKLQHISLVLHRDMGIFCQLSESLLVWECQEPAESFYHGVLQRDFWQYLCHRIYIYMPDEWSQSVTREICPIGYESRAVCDWWGICSKLKRLCKVIITVCWCVFCCCCFFVFFWGGLFVCFLILEISATLKL